MKPAPVHQGHPQNHSGNFTNETVITLNNFDRNGVIDIKSELSKRKVFRGERTLLLNSSYHAKLEKDTTIVSALINTDAGNAITTGQIPNISGFKPIEADYLPSADNLVGIGFRSDALCMATRVPGDYTTVFPDMPATAKIDYVTDPQTGITVMVVKFSEHQMGTSTMRVAIMYGVAKGQTAAGERLVSAATS